MKVFLSLLVQIVIFNAIVAQVPIQKLNYPSTNYYGSDMDVSDDGKYFATTSASSGSTSSKIYIYELKDNKYELIHKDFSSFEIGSVDFVDNNVLVIAEGLANIYRSANIFTITLNNDNKWVKNASIITDPEDRNEDTGSGYSVSKNGKVLALGVPSTNKVYIYDIQSPTAAVQRNIIEAEPFEKDFGGHVSLSDNGNRISITSFDPEVTRVYENNNGNWVIIHTFEYTKGHTMLSGDGRTVMTSNGPKIQVHKQNTNNSWESSELTTFNTGDNGNGWNIINCEFLPEFGHITVGMLNAYSQKTKLASLDLEGQKWIERRSVFYDTKYDDYGGINVATSINGSLLFTSRPRVNNIKGEVYRYDVLKGTSIGLAAFRDKNRNGIFDTNEKLITDCSFWVNGNVEIFAINDYNYASIYGPAQQVVLNYDKNKYIATTPDSINIDLQIVADNKHLFGIDYINSVTDAAVNAYDYNFLCNTISYHKTKILNSGTEPIYAEIEFKYKDLEYSSTNAEWIANTDSTLVIKSDILDPGELIYLKNYFKMPDETLAGEIISLICNVKVFEAESNTLVKEQEFDNSFLLLCSYDPNDKSVSPIGQGANLLTLKDQELLFKVRFQNTGNYPASNVVVRDDIDPNLDLSTFRFIESSHPLTQVGRRNRNIEFVFENIMLPDSISNEAGSHGFVVYAIKPYQNIADYTKIKNTAYIYFDFNDPVVTNTTISNMVEAFPTVAVDNVSTNYVDYEVYPNPIDDKLNVKLFQNSVVILYDLQGNNIYENSFLKGEHVLNLKNLTSGTYLIRVIDKISQKSKLKTIIKI